MKQSRLNVFAPNKKIQDLEQKLGMRFLSYHSKLENITFKYREGCVSIKVIFTFIVLCRKYYYQKNQKYARTFSFYTSVLVLNFICLHTCFQMPITRQCQEFRIICILGYGSCSILYQIHHKRICRPLHRYKIKAGVHTIPIETSHILYYKIILIPFKRVSQIDEVATADLFHQENSSLRNDKS